MNTLVVTHRDIQIGLNESIHKPLHLISPHLRGLVLPCSFCVSLRNRFSDTIKDTSTAVISNLTRMNYDQNSHLFSITEEPVGML